ncbi:hypothetical protein [Mycobacterium haemophilum]
MRILLTGATGNVSSRLVAALFASRRQVLAATRNPGLLKHFGWSNRVAPVISDASDPALARAPSSLAADTTGHLPGWIGVQ